MVMMEAFVHDPLINWRLFTLPEVPHMPGQGRGAAPGNPDEGNGIPIIPSPPQRGVQEREILQVRLRFLTMLFIDILYSQWWQ